MQIDTKQCAEGAGHLICKKKKKKRTFQGEKQHVVVHEKRSAANMDNSSDHKMVLCLSNRSNFSKKHKSQPFFLIALN